ncbi:MAG TPA: hypothetical protein VGJ15_01630, partial [Pirellulales bacterium]
MVSLGNRWFTSRNKQTAKSSPNQSTKHLRPKPRDRQIETLEHRSLLTGLTAYTMPLVNDTGLDPTKFAIYAAGYSTSDQLELQSDGTWGATPSGSGNIPSYKVGSGAGELSQISWSNNQE